MTSRISRRCYRVLFASFVLTLPAGGIAAQSCGNAGALQLTVDGGRLGDAWTAALAGMPGALAAVGIDYSPGPVPTPFGNICLGATPAVIPLVLNAQGSAAFSLTLPASPAFTGVSWFHQGAALDLAAPGGVALTAGTTTLLRSPRVFVLDAGMVGSPFGGPVPAQVVAFDALSGSLLWTRPLTVPAAMILHSRIHDLVFVGTGSQVLALDGSTGLTAFTLPMTTTDMALLPNESSLLTMSPTEVRLTPLPSGGPTAAYPHGMTLGNGSFRGDRLMLMPDTSIAYMRGAGVLVPFDYVAAQVLPAASGYAPAGNILGWAQGANLLAVVDRNADVHLIDVATNAALPGSPVSTSIFTYAAAIAFGPTPTGGGFIMATWNGGNVVEILPNATLGYTGSYGPGLVDTVVLSPLGTEWLFERQGVSPFGAREILTFDPATMNLVATSPTFSGIGGLGHLESDSLYRAVFAAGNDVYLMPTDPVGTPFLLGTFISPSPFGSRRFIAVD